MAGTKELARSISGVDIIVGGHSHSLLSNARKDAVGPYPVVERSPSGDTVLVVTAYYGGEMLGRLNVTFDERGGAAVVGRCFDPERCYPCQPERAKTGSSFCKKNGKIFCASAKIVE